MAYRRWILLLLSAGLGPGIVRAQPLDTAKLDEARSAVSEVLAVSRARGRGQVTDVYASGVRAAARKNLEKLLRDPALKEPAGEALRALDAGDATALTALQERMIALERAHGRAD